MGLHGRVLSKLGVRADEHNTFSLTFPDCEIEVTDFSSILMVQAGVKQAHDMLQGLVVSEEAALCGSEELFVAGIKICLQP